MITGMAAYFNTISSKMAMARKMKRSLLLAQLKFLNFKANRGSSAISSRLEIKDKRSNSHGFKINRAMELYSLDRKNESILKINGREHIIIAFAGVGRPMNDSDWRASLLNLAKRIAEKRGMMSAKYAGKYVVLSETIPIKSFALAPRAKCVRFVNSIIL